MPTLKLSFVLLPTNDIETIAIQDNSVYPTDPPVVSAPTIEITPPSFDTVSLPFVVEGYNAFNSYTLGITAVDVYEPLPDGIYHFKYSVAPAYENYVEKSFLRTDALQMKFDEAFMTLDMMECDQAIKKQSFVDLMSIYFFIQGAIAAANNCAEIEAIKLYNQANRMLTTFIKHDCGCSGNNYLN